MWGSHSIFWKQYKSACFKNIRGCSHESPLGVWFFLRKKNVCQREKMLRYWCRGGIFWEMLKIFQILVYNYQSRKYWAMKKFLGQLSEYFKSSLKCLTSHSKIFATSSGKGDRKLGPRDDWSYFVQLRRAFSLESQLRSPILNVTACDPMVGKVAALCFCTSSDTPFHSCLSISLSHFKNTKK